MAKTKNNQVLNILVNYRKATYQYEVLHTYTAGIALDGAEVKSIRTGNADLKGAHCYFQNNELYLSGMHVAHYKPATHYKKPATRLRKLLLTKHELHRLQKKKAESGLTIVPLNVFLNKKHWIKVTIALVRGKKKHDKRTAIKERDIERRIRKKVDI